MMNISENEVQSLSADLEVIIDGTSHNFRWPLDKSLVEAMEEMNLNPPFSCLVGKCGACVCTIEEGSVFMNNNEVLDDSDIQEKYILGCQSRPTTEKIKIIFE